MNYLKFEEKKPYISNKETSRLDEGKDGEGGFIPSPIRAPNKATSLRLLRGVPFGLKAKILNQQEDWSKIIRDQGKPDTLCKSGKPSFWNANTLNSS